MTFAVGIFDLFTYTISGSVYLALFCYVAVRLRWVDLAHLGAAPVPVLVAGVVLSYLIGYLAYPLGAEVNRRVPRRRQRDPRGEFLRRVPAAEGRGFVQVDPFLLLSAIQLHDKDVATDVIRLRAVGLMLRNCAPPLLLGLLVAVVEVFAGGHPLLALGSAVVCLVGAFSLVVQARRMGHWATMKTLELCFWLPDIDEKVTK